MPNQFTIGKKAIAICDVCGFQYRLNRLKAVVVKGIKTEILACRSCWDKDHPQLKLGMYPVHDPQAVRNPRNDNTYWEAGLTGFRVTKEPPPESVCAFGEPSGGSRVIQWGWNPVGLNNVYGLTGLIDNMETSVGVGSVEISYDPVPQSATVLVDTLVVNCELGSVETLTP